MTSADAVGQIVGAVKQVVSIAALAASGAGAAGAAGGAASGGSVSASTSGAAVGGSSLGGGESALSHLNAAQELTGRAATFEAMGLNTPAAYNRSLAHGHELAARQTQLTERMQRFGGAQTQSPDFGFSSSVNTAIQSNFNGSTEDFKRGFEALSPHVSQHGLDPNALAAQYPEDTAHMVQAYLGHTDEINGASDPLYRSAELGKASQVQGMITFMPLNKKDEGESA